MDITAQVYAALAGAFLMLTSMMGIGWFKSVTKRIEHLEQLALAQANAIADQQRTIGELVIKRDSLSARLRKHGLEEESC